MLSPWPTCSCASLRCAASTCRRSSCHSLSTSFRSCSSPRQPPRARPRVTGAEELRKKETDRIAVMARGLNRSASSVEELPDGARITGGRVRGGPVDSRGDHRIAMAFCGREPARERADRHRQHGRSGHVVSELPRSGGGRGPERASGEQRSVSQGTTPPVVAVDGPSGSGKGTVSRQLAVRLGWHYLDSGALYRLVALAALRKRRRSRRRGPAWPLVAAALNVRFAPAGELERVYLDDARSRPSYARSRPAKRRPGSRPCQPFGPLCCNANATSRVGQASWRTAAIWAAWFSPPRR